MRRINYALKVKHPFGFYYSLEEISDINGDIPLELEVVIDGEPRTLGRYRAKELQRNRERIERSIAREVRNFERVLAEDLLLMAMGPLILYTTPYTALSYKDRLQHILVKRVKRIMKS